MNRKAIVFFIMCAWMLGAPDVALSHIVSTLPLNVFSPVSKAHAQDSLITTPSSPSPEATPSSSISKSIKPGSGIEIDPALLDVNIEQKDPQKDVSIFLTNHNATPITLELRAIDFLMRDLTGITQFLGEKSDSYSYSLASYIQLPFTEIELEPGERKEVPLRITNRQDLSPGGHYAGVIARQKYEKPSQKQTTILPSVASLIFLRKKGGEQFNLSIKDVDWPKEIVEFSYPKKIALTFQNEGNIHLIPHGRIEITNMFGRLVSKGILNVSSVYVFPSSRRQISVEMKQLRPSFPLSFNRITIKGQDTLKKTHLNYSETYIYFSPVFGFGLLFLAISMFIYRKRHHIRSHMQKRKKS